MNLFRVILLPGSVLPAQLAYGSLVAALDPDAETVARELEVYSTEEASPTTTWISRSPAWSARPMPRGWERFHLVGYSGGGAAALAVVARQPDRVSGLALRSPLGRVDWDRSRPRWRSGARNDRLESVHSSEFIRGFMRLNVRPGVELPPPPRGDPPPGWRSPGRDPRVHARRSGPTTSTARLWRDSIGPPVPDGATSTWRWRPRSRPAARRRPDPRTLGTRHLPPWARSRPEPAQTMLRRAPTTATEKVTPPGTDRPERVGKERSRPPTTRPRSPGRRASPQSKC